MSVEVKAQNTLSMTSVKAIKDATDEANTLLDGMRQSAIDAGTTLNGIYQDAMDAQASADNAQASADSASEYASRAYANLSTLQSLTETLNWITAHGTMTLTTDTQLDPRHIYFVADQNGDYVVGGQHYAVVSEPDVADISTYYELSINESLNNYVATHLAVDGEGLWIIPDAGGNKVLIATGSGSTYTSAGTYIIGKENGVDVVLAQFGSTSRIGKASAGNGNVVTENDGISLRVGTETVGSLKQIKNYVPPDFGEGFTYDNVLQLNAIQFFQLISDSDIVMEAGTKYVTTPDMDAPNYDPNAPTDEQPTITTNEGTQINFRVPNGRLGLGGKDNETPNNAVYSGDLVDLWEEVENPSGNPELQGWYVRFYPYEDDDEYYIYQKTFDTTVDTSKTYYRQTDQAFGIGATVTDQETAKEYGWVGLHINNYDGDGLTRGVYDATLPYSEWIIGRNEDGTMKLFGKTLGDYIVDQGTLGVWTYRKWESGVSECWCTWSGTVASYTSVFGGYGYYKDVYFPTDMFNVAPKPFFTVNVGSGFGVSAMVLPISATSGRFFFVGSAGGSQSVTLRLYLIGTWK